MKTNLETILSSVKSASICGITYISEPKMRKTNNPYYNRVQMVVTTTMQFGYNYETSCQNREEKEVGSREFVAESLPWGEWKIVNKIIEHKGELYGRFYKMSNVKDKVLFLIDGRIASENEVEEIRSFMAKPTESAKQASYGIVENQCKPRTIKLGNIVRLKISGMEIDGREIEVVVNEEISQVLK